MATQGTHFNVQAVRRVHENGHPANTASASAETIYIVCHPDASSGRDILLWDDILAVFSTALYVRSGAVALPFLKGPNFKNLDPLRIAAVPGVILDIVVKGQVGENDLSVESLQNAPTTASEASNNAISVNTSNSAPTSIRRNPVGGLVETAWENYMYIDDTPPTAVINHPLADRRNPVGGLVEQAMDAYRNNDNPAFAPPPRGPQIIPDEEAPKDHDAQQPESFDNKNNTSSRAPQELVSGVAAQEITAIMMNARLGDKHAQNALGDMYKDGKQVQQDYQAAMDWYLKAAEQGLARAQFNIGDMYDYGRGVPGDFSKAMDWFRKAVAQGDSAAQCSIGHLYQNGQGVSQDYSKAMEWHQKAASQGEATAQYSIGYLYQN
ncbi:hypothetical protein BGW39_004174, partial [Mortierella sp. 14UC]